MPISRRKFVQNLALTGAFWAVPRWARAAFAAPERTLSLQNLHTGEAAQNLPYWVNGAYQPDALRELSQVLRDHRTGEAAPMDTAVLDQLYALGRRLATRPTVHIISGYRSPKTNAMLHARSSGVAKGSLHLQAKAIDLRMPGIALSDLRAAALELKAGGVGYYPASNFVHIDSGRVRQWAGQ